MRGEKELVGEVLRVPLIWGEGGRESGSGWVWGCGGGGGVVERSEGCGVPRHRTPLAWRPQRNTAFPIVGRHNRGWPRGGGANPELQLSSL
jgi:hypothetical protein